VISVTFVSGLAIFYLLADSHEGKQLGIGGAGANAIVSANSFGSGLGGLGYGGSNAFAASSAQAGG